MRRTTVMVFALLISFTVSGMAETVPVWRHHLPIPIATLREAFDQWDHDLADEPFITVMSDSFFLHHWMMDWETLGALRRYVHARFDWAPLTPLALDWGLIKPKDTEHLGMRVLLLYAAWKATNRLEWGGLDWPAAVLDVRAPPRASNPPSPVTELDIPVEEFHRHEDADETLRDAPQGIQ